MKGDKSGKDLWESAWRESPLAKYYGIEKYLAINKKLDILFNKFLNKGDKRILEIGCAKAKWLIHFAKEFGYDVYGIDYSEKGVELAKQNLIISRIKGTILCEDIFQTSLVGESFDIVYSMGLIEHFDNPAEIIDKHIKLLKTGGKLIITVPNYRNSLYIDLRKLIGSDKHILETHNLSTMDKKVLDALSRNKGIKISFLDYFGPIDLALVFDHINSRPILYLIHLINQMIGYGTFLMPSSKYFSPYLIMIGQKV